MRIYCGKVSLAKEGLRGRYDSAARLRPMHQCRYVVGQCFLRQALVGGCAVALIKFLDALTGEKSEDFEAFDDITIIGVEPKLIHRKGACEIAIQPKGVDPPCPGGPAA